MLFVDDLYYNDSNKVNLNSVNYDFNLITILSSDCAFQLYYVFVIISISLINGIIQ